MAINNKLLPVKAHYFFSLGAASPIFPFIPLIIKEMGFSATIAGTMNTIIPLSCMVAKPWLGMIADKFNAHKAILISLVLASATLTVGFRWVTPLPTDNSVMMDCRPNSTSILITSNRAGDECFMKELTTRMNHSMINCTFTTNVYENDVALKDHDTMKPYERMFPSTGEILLTMDSPKSEDKFTISVQVNSAYTRGNTWSHPSCLNTTTVDGYLECNSPALQNIVTKSFVRDSKVIHYSQFWYLLALVLGLRVISSCIENVSDSVCFKLLASGAHQYGLQRMWGSAGWGFFSIITGALVDAMSNGKSTSDRSVAFYLSAIISLIDVAVCLCLKVKKVHSKKNEKIVANVGAVFLRNPKSIMFLILLVSCGILSSMMWNFLFWLIEDIAKEDGCSDQSKIQTLNGLVLAVNCYVGEIPFFFLSGWFLRTFGYEQCMSLVLVAFGVKFISYYFLTNPWWVLPIEILNGISFGLLYTTMTTYANALTPPGLEGTVQGFVSAVFEGIGVAFGSLLSGYLFDLVGGRTMFLYGGSASLFLAAVHSVLLLSLMESGTVAPPDADLDSSDYDPINTSSTLNEYNLEEHSGDNNLEGSNVTGLLEN